MLDEEMRYFLEYCRISDFSEKSIESLTTRLSEFNELLKTTTVTSLIDICYQHLRRFVADYKSPPSLQPQLIESESGSDQAISLISQNNRSKNRCFQALYHPFRPQNGHHRVLMALEKVEGVGPS